jgi:hypothetical protein
MCRNYSGTQYKPRRNPASVPLSVINLIKQHWGEETNGPLCVWPIDIGETSVTYSIQGLEGTVMKRYHETQWIVLIIHPLFYK